MKANEEANLTEVPLSSFTVLFTAKLFSTKAQAVQYKFKAGAKWQNHSNRGEGEIIVTLANAKSSLPPF